MRSTWVLWCIKPEFDQDKAIIRVIIDIWAIMGAHNLISGTNRV